MPSLYFLLGLPPAFNRVGFQLRRGQCLQHQQGLHPISSSRFGSSFISEADGSNSASPASQHLTACTLGLLLLGLPLQPLPFPQHLVATPFQSSTNILLLSQYLAAGILVLPPLISMSFHSSVNPQQFALCVLVLPFLVSLSGAHSSHL